MKFKIFTPILLVLVSITCISMLGKYQADLKSDWEVPEEYKTMKNPYANNKDINHTGKTLFLKHCKMCHGENGKGNGKMARLLDIEVGNFTTETFKSQSDGSMYYKFLYGKNEMPGFKKKIINEEQQWLIINYIKTL